MNLTQTQTITVFASYWRDVNSQTLWLFYIIFMGENGTFHIVSLYCVILRNVTPTVNKELLVKFVSIKRKSESFVCHQIGM
jgi:hypothetical protein